jgi:1-acyl-sn-glycerol-3-phosphate acyltransferase
MVMFYVTLAIALIEAVIMALTMPFSWNLLWSVPVSFLGTFVGSFVVISLVVGLLSLTIDMKKKYNNQGKFFRDVLHEFYGYFGAVSGVKLHVEGLELLPKEKFLIISNHRSNYDHMLQNVGTGRRDIAYISKPENFKIPIAGRLVHRCCYMAIDRENPRNAVATINESAQLISSNTASVGVYPEGTRSKTGVLLDFKSGCFKIAQKAKCPIVIAAISGTEKIHNNIFRRKTDVYLTILKVLEPEFILGRRTTEISDYARGLIEAELSRH